MSGATLPLTFTALPIHPLFPSPKRRVLPMGVPQGAGKECSKRPFLKALRHPCLFASDPWELNVLNAFPSLWHSLMKRQMEWEEHSLTGHKGRPVLSK